MLVDNLHNDHSALAVSADEKLLRQIEAALARDCRLFQAKNSRSAMEIMETHEVHCVVSDLLIDETNGVELLSRFKKLYPDAIRILISDSSTNDVALDAVNRCGVHRLFVKPVDTYELRHALKEELESFDMHVSYRLLTENLIRTNEELQRRETEILAQKERLEKLNLEYLEKKELALQMSEKFARANLDLLRAQEEIKLKNIRLEAANKQLERLSITDGLTGFYNHRYMQNLLDGEIGRAKRYSLDLSVIMVDLDHFKTVNDTYGHLFGDVVLKKATEIIRRNIRDIDIPTRYGGDEFLLVLPHTTMDDALFLAVRVHQDIEAHVIHIPQENFKEYRQTASLGVAHYPHPDIANREDLIQKADQALYEAKNNGRNQVTVFK